MFAGACSSSTQNTCMQSSMGRDTHPCCGVNGMQTVNVVWTHRCTCNGCAHGVCSSVVSVHRQAIQMPYNRIKMLPTAQWLSLSCMLAHHTGLDVSMPQHSIMQTYVCKQLCGLCQLIHLTHWTPC